MSSRRPSGAPTPRAAGRKRGPSRRTLRSHDSDVCGVICGEGAGVFEILSSVRSAFAETPRSLTSSQIAPLQPHSELDGSPLSDPFRPTVLSQGPCRYWGREFCGGEPAANAVSTNNCSDLKTSAVVLENIAVFGSDYLRMKLPLGSHYLRMSAH